MHPQADLQEKVPQENVELLQKNLFLMNPEGNGARRHVKSADKMDVKGAIDEPSVKIPVQIAIEYHVRVEAVLFQIQSVGGIGIIVGLDRWIIYVILDMQQFYLSQNV
ncbi:hypothetical protein B0H14DRAFT_2637495 [Mycena olivaceomarginata]|nr:hypothetical protein B0H14DRAFT_2637495 [Mycena olivaceomarginata]